MKIINQSYNYGAFPMVVKCKQVIDEHGFSYGEEKDFCGSELEIDMNDIKEHPWFKYPNYTGTDYGVICPVCGNFIVIDKQSIPVSALRQAERITIRI